MAPMRCCVCNASAFSKCITCDSAPYCSPACTTKDEPTHSLLCQPFVEFIRKTPRPSPSAKLALYFPIFEPGNKGQIPQFIWHENLIKVPRDTAAGALLGDDKHNPKDIFIDHNWDTGARLDHAVILHLRHAFQFDGSRANMSLVETTQGEMMMNWRGPLLVYAKPDAHYTMDQDITLGDFRAFLDYVKTYPSSGRLGPHLKANLLLELEVTNPTLWNSLLLKHSVGQTFNGVEITCTADQEFLKLDKFITVDVSIVHPILDDENYPHPPTEISKLLDLPIMFRKCFPDKRWKDKMPQRAMGNMAAQFLDINTDVTSDTWGMHNLGQDHQHLDEKGWDIFGRVLVIRHDKKDLTDYQVEALIDFLQHGVYEEIVKERHGRLFGLSQAELEVERAKLMKELASKAKFEAAFKIFKEKKIKGGDKSWINEMSPYGTTPTPEDGLSTSRRGMCKDWLDAM
jgi:hypothetical protein